MYKIYILKEFFEAMFHKSIASISNKKVNLFIAMSE